MRPRPFAAALAALALAGSAAAEERLLPVGKLFPLLQNYLALPAASRDRFRPLYVLKAKEGSLAGLRIATILDGRRSEVPVLPDGRVGRLPTSAELARGQVAIDAPTGTKLGMSLELAAILPAATEYAAPALEAAVVQADAGARKAAGVMALAAPRLDRLVFRGAEAGELVAADGRRSALPTAGGHPYYRPSKNVAARIIRLRRPPAVVLIAGKD